MKRQGIFGIIEKMLKKDGCVEVTKSIDGHNFSYTIIKNDIIYNITLEYDELEIEYSTDPSTKKFRKKISTTINSYNIFYIISQCFKIDIDYKTSKEINILNGMS